MTVKTLSGAKLSIGPAVTAAEADSLAEFEALVYQQVGEVEDMGESGDEAPLVTFASVGDGRVRNLKGARNAGVQALVVGHDPLDVGQQALIAAEGTQFEFAIKIELADAPTPEYTNTIIYKRCLVASKRIRMGTNDNVVRRAVALAATSGEFEAPAEQFTS